jgi:hypothetical protein
VKEKHELGKKRNEQFASVAAKNNEIDSSRASTYLQTAARTATLREQGRRG